MLVNPKFKKVDNFLLVISTLASGSSYTQSTPDQISEGCYLSNHYNPHIYLNRDEWEQFWEHDWMEQNNWKPLPIFEFGVCDSPEQLLAKTKYKRFLNKKDREYTVFFTPVYKKNQPKEGGWRWEKWGPYEGKQKSRADYLYDESNIDLVYCFHIFRKKD